MGVLEEKGYGRVRAHSDKQFFFGKGKLSQKLSQSICVHTQQRKVLKKLCYRIFVNVSLFVLQRQRVFIASHIFDKCQQMSHFPRRYCETLSNIFIKDHGVHKQI